MDLIGVLASLVSHSQPQSATVGLVRPVRLVRQKLVDLLTR